MLNYDDLVMEAHIQKMALYNASFHIYTLNYVLDNGLACHFLTYIKMFGNVIILNHHRLKSNNDLRLFGSKTLSEQMLTC